MRFFVSLLLLALSFMFVESRVLYNRVAIPAEWSLVGRAAPVDFVDFSIALTQRNLNVLEQKFWEVTDPEHENYQQYMTIDQINAIVAPPQDVQQKVINWLTSRGVQSNGIKNLQDSLDVRCTVAAAERLFGTKIHVFQHKTEGKKIVRSMGEYSVPDFLDEDIQMVIGLSSFPIPHLGLKRKSIQNGKRQLLQSFDIAVVPQTLYSLYNIPAEVLSSDLSTSQGVIEFQGQSYAPTDLSAFASNANMELQALSADHIIGPNAPSSPQVEATLDIEFIASVNTEADNWFWLEDGNGWLYQFGTHFFSTATVPDLVSISYGWWEGDQCDISGNCQTLGVNSTGYVMLVNTQFQKIGLRGKTLVSASGDSGANGRTDEGCSIPQLRPAYPGASPFVTAVGANQLQNPVFNLPGAARIPLCQLGAQCPSGGTEVAVSFAVAGFASGGGFSNISSTPSYQRAAVAAYLNSGVALPPTGYFNPGGRGMPDISAMGHNCMIYTQGQGEAVGGTSCAAPIVAGVFALLNQEAIKVLGAPLGFLNPFIYKAFAANPQNFNDVTIGDNKCTESGCASTCTGFLCAVGWDPVTGVGSPNFGNLKAYISQLKAERDAKFPQRK